MRGDEHYREAERLLELAQVPPRDRAVSGWLTADELVAAAQVHATLAHAAAVIEAADHEPGDHDLVSMPYPAGEAERAYPGTPWGRAFYGDRHLTSTNDQEA